MQQSGILEDAYEILETLGQGGFGIVYKARQRTTGQMVAIKMMLPRGGAARSEKMVARFLRETHLCARLYHPNIVQLINAGETGSGQLYTVFAYAPGDSLSHVLTTEGPLEPEETRYLMLQVLDALASAHERGIVHRDLKPGNIMIVATGARRNALVLDFGISTIVKGAGSAEHERLTATAEMLGTPGYAAPEQLHRGESSPATDLFSWGLVYLECLTGRPVYAASTLHAMLQKQLGPEPVAIPASVRHHPLGKLLEAVTRKDPAARPRSAAAVLKRLEACSLRGLSRARIAAGVSPGGIEKIVSTITLLGEGQIEVPASSGPAEPAVPVERWRVTALCCDLRVRAAAPGRPLDVEEHNRCLAELFDACLEVVQQHDGYLVGVLGEQALFLFGYPQADEQDARRAARAALALRAAMAVEGERRLDQGIALTVRAGIHAGFIVTPLSIGVEDVSVIAGATPSIAARLAGAAPPGAIVVSAVAQRLLRSVLDFEAAGLADDAAEPQRLYRLHAERGAPAVATALPEPAAPLVGRDPEIKLLVQRWEQARLGTGQCSLITGEPGIGKSRLADELRRRVRDDPHTLLTCRCAPGAQGSPLLPVIGLVERLLERESLAPGAGKLARLESLLSRHGMDLEANVPPLSALLSVPAGERYRPLDASPDLRRERTLESLQALVFALAETRPALMLVEDLHWADPATLGLLSRLIERVSSAPLCLILTARAELSPAALPMRGGLQISLSRLASGDVEMLVAEIYEGRGLPDEVLQQIIRRTNGVPLFVEELAHLLVEVGVLVPAGDAYEMGRPLADADIPASLRGLLTSRVDRAGGAARRAAAIGRGFLRPRLAAGHDEIA